MRYVGLHYPNIAIFYWESAKFDGETHHVPYGIANVGWHTPISDTPGYHTVYGGFPFMEDPQ